MKKIYLLDFDGVICDSFKECIYVAYSSVYKKINYYKFNRFFSKYKNILKKYNAETVKGIDYCKIIKIYEKNKFKKKIDLKKIKLPNAYNQLFYVYRKKIIDSNFNLWIKLNPIFPKIKKILKKKISKDIRILSNKDYNSIKLILKHNDIKIDNKKIFSKEKFKTKKKYIINLLKNKNSQIVFIDDHIANLSNLNFKNIKKYLLIGNDKVYNNIEGKLKKNKIQKIKLNKIINIFQ